MKNTLLFCFMALTLFNCKNVEIESLNKSTYPNDRVNAIVDLYKGLYVDGFQSILGDSAQENKLLKWCNQKGFNAISLHELNIIFANGQDAQLANFIKKARIDYGIQEVSAVRGSSANFNQNATYDASRADLNERFNVYNLENEWWNNGSSCNFNCYTTILQTMQQKADAAYPKIIKEAYIGWFQNPNKPANQAATLVLNLDRLLIHDYRTAPDFAYLQERLSYIGQAAKNKNKVFDIITIFSAEQIFMGNYFSLTGQNKSFDDAYNTLLTQFNASTFTGKSNISMVGYQVYTYSLAAEARP